MDNKETVNIPHRDHLSQCCKAILKVCGHTTVYYVCTACDKPSDLLSWKKEENK